MKTLMASLAGFLTASLIACAPPENSSPECPPDAPDCSEPMEVEEDGFLPMPSIELKWDEETTHMEGWIQAAQLEAVDGVKRVPTWTANGLHILPYTV